MKKKVRFLITNWCLLVPFFLFGGIDKAEELFEAALYADAIPFYTRALEESESLLHSMQIRLRLGQAYFLNGQYEQCCSVTKENLLEQILPLSMEDEIQRSSLYLSGICHRHLGHYESAVDELSQYLQRDEKENLYFYEEAQFELGLSHLAIHQLDGAKNVFESLSSDRQKPRLAFLSSLYLARVQMVERKYEEAEKILSSLKGSCSVEDPLRFELFYQLGEAYFQLHNYAKAAEHFEQSIPKNEAEKCAWYEESCYLLGWSYLKLGDQSQMSLNEKSIFLKKSVELFQSLMKVQPDEKCRLALGQSYLTCASHLNDNEYYSKADAVLADLQNFETRESQAHALLLRAQAASSYADRDKFYRQLTQDANRESDAYPKGWYLRGLNNFQEGQRLTTLGQGSKAVLAFERACDAFEKAFEFLKDTEKGRAALAIKYLILAHALQPTYEKQSKAYQLLANFMETYPKILLSADHPDEFYYLLGSIAGKLTEEEPKFGEKAISILNQGLEQFPRGKFAQEALNLLGAVHYRQGNYQLAESYYLRLAEEFSDSNITGEALLWAAKCGDRLERNSEECRRRRTQVYEKYPDSVYAPEAYFECYTYRDYLQGDRAAVKHLQGLPERYSQSPYAMQANFLIGLDFKRDRKTPEGKWIRKKDLTKAIDAFQDVESLFDQLYTHSAIPEDRELYYLTLRYRAILERALANFTIADESQGAKRQIYLEYAEEVFSQITGDFENSKHELTKELWHADPLPSIYEESCYWLAQTHIKKQNTDAAEKIFSKMLDRYNQLKITRGYYLSRVWHEQGLLAMSQKEHHLALECFRHAEDAAKGRGVLSTDQRLDLWIQQSLCYKELNQSENAILLLSKVVNDDAISGLRLKALYLRAEIYELQGRPELARKQLISTAKKGGEWALKAKEKLRKEYGYQ